MHARTLRWPDIVYVAFLLLLSPAMIQAQDMNQVKSISSVSVPQPGVEIEFESSKPFPVGAMPPVLMLGGASIMNSRHPEDGSLNKIIFFLTPEQFAAARTGERMVVTVGLNVPTQGLTWDFGSLDKSLLR